ncbi:MAG: GNAT family N-acetyltransferase [Candidatus Eremiobacteraeota bacterium]|nr:GNAT family N-acetyltransferase [Candidatus Eremiobacteraeota bacterium]
MKASERIVVDERIDLAVADPRFAAELFAVIDRDRADLREWLSWVDGTLSVADLRRYSRFSRSQFDAGGGFEYAIRLEGKLVGGIGFNALDRTNQSAAIGYWISPQARGNGIVTRAARTLTEYGFSSLGFERIEIRCVVENLRSRAVAERLGFALEGILRKSYLLHGAFRDLAVYGKTR